MKNERQQTHRKTVKQKKVRVNKRRLLLVLLIAAFAVGGIVALNLAGVIAWPFVVEKQDVHSSLMGGAMPGYAGKGKITTLSDQGQVEKQPETPAFRINTEPAFAGGLSKGRLDIVNPSENAYNMHIEILLNDTQESVYSSGVLRPGESIVEDSLSKNMRDGEYAALAYIYFYDVETSDMLFQTAAGLRIKVG